MNKTVPSPTNWPEQKRRKPGGIRAIDKGTSYDVAGKLRHILRALEKGDHGEVRGVAATFICGRGERVVYHHANYGMASAAERKDAARSLVRWLEAQEQ